MGQDHDEKKCDSCQGLTRRGFLKTVGASAVAVTVSGKLSAKAAT